MKRKIIDVLIFICVVIFIYVLAFILTIALTEEAPKKEPVQVVYEEYSIEPIVYEVQTVINPRDLYLERLDEVNDIQDSLEWFKAYKALNEEFADYGEIEWIDDVFSEDEIYLLERVVESECHGADFDSKTHVAAVVLARLENERFPDTLTEVIMQPNQFYVSKTEIDEETKLAVEYAFCVATAADDCLWFHSMTKQEKFSGGDYVFSDNCHHFYK
jgi:hypothetical protein